MSFGIHLAQSQIIHFNMSRSPLQCNNAGFSVIGNDELPMQNASAEEELRDLDARRAYIVEQVTTCQNALSSPQWWPTELIRMIILLIVRCPEKLFSMRDDPRLSILQISSRWREIAFDIAELWDIDLEMYPMTIQHDSFFKLIGAWFSQCNAGISLKAPGKMNHCPIELVNYAIIPNSHHFRQLHLKTTGHSMQSILALPAGSFTALEDLVLEEGDDAFDPFFSVPSGALIAASACRDYSPMNAATAFVSASCLRTVQTSIFTRDHRKLQFPWSQLTEFTVYSAGVGADVCLSILLGCTSLERCSIVFIHQISDATASRIAVLSNTPVHLPRLKHLHLWLPDSQRVDQFLSSLVLPNLRELRLRGGFGGWPDYVTLMPTALDCIEFLHHFSSTLLVLALEQGDARSAVVNFERMLAVTPHVRNVTLRYGFQLRRSTMNMIAEGTLLPNVEDISIDVDDGAAVIDMLKTRQAKAQASLSPTSRAQSLSLLKKVTINWENHHRPPTMIEKEAFEDMRSMGLEIIVHGADSATLIM
jgi:hypothetical protein